MRSFLAYSETGDEIFTQRLLLSSVVQPMWLNIDMNMLRFSEVLRLDLKFFLHQFLDFLEKQRCGVPWDNLQLEHERLSIKVVQFTAHWS